MGLERKEVRNLRREKKIVRIENNKKRKLLEVKIIRELIKHQITGE